MRTAAVAGRFYPGSKEELKKTIKEYLTRVKEKEREIATCAISPHAGYLYSGEVAAKSIASLKKADTYIIIGPSHQGMGTGVSLSNEDWETPLGKIETNNEIIEELKNVGVVENNAHLGEHSIEVQLPFLQILREEFKIVPIMLSLQDVETIKNLSDKIKELMKDKDIGLIGSSDFTHYQPRRTAKEQDKEAINKIMELDLNNFLGLIKEKNLSICGYGPIGVLMEISRELELVPEFLEYKTSADQTGDTSQVVGYASIVFK